MAQPRFNTLAEVCAQILPLTSVIVASHYNPDTDAYGSSLGLGLALRALGKRVVILNENGVLARYRFMPGVGEILKTVPEGQFDAVIACDCGDEKRLGDSLKGPLQKFPALICIDHHRSNLGFGTTNLIEPEASSASEMVFNILEELAQRTGKQPVTQDVATCLYAGILGDTGSFRYSSTRQETFATAYKLVGYGAEPAAIAEALYGSRRLSSVLLQAEALCSLELSHEGRLAQVVITAQTMVKYKATSDDTEELVEKMRDIEGVVIAVFIREEDGYWKVSMRSKKPEYDLSILSAKFGGGGHLAAAGFRWRGEYNELRQKLSAELDALLQARR